MCRKWIYLASFVLVLGLVSNASAEFGEGQILVEWWLDIGGGNAVVDLTWQPDFPDNPTGSSWLDTFEVPQSGKPADLTVLGDNYGARLRGYLYPPASGDYTFWITGDNGSDFLLSTDDDPANATVICQVPGTEWTGAREWDKFPNDQKSATVTLEAGQKYYVEAIYKEGGGADGVAIGWGGPTIGAGPVVIDGQHLSSVIRPVDLMASNPEPADGSIHPQTWARLQWLRGCYAASHEVYFGDNFDDVNDGAEGTFQGWQTGTYFTVGLPGHPYPDGLVPGVKYYWRIDEVNDLHPDSPWEGDVWNFTIPPRTAYDPYPVDDIDFIDPNVTLSWEPGFSAKLHNVYLGDNFANVNDADTSDTTGIYRGVQAATTYTPGPLALDSPYYWRVDELVGSARSRKTHKGDVWSFTTARSGTGTIGREVFVRVIGPEEIVFDWTTDRCEMRDVPDVPARAFRDADGKVQLIASHSVNRRMIGNTLDSVQHDCNIVMNSDKDPDPSKFNDRESIFSLYTLDGETIYALVHNEYHALSHGQCPSGDARKCTYIAVTFAKSTDKGRTYSHPTAPDHLVATEPYPYDPDAGPRGMYSPSNIVHNPNSGYYYALPFMAGSGLQEGGLCVMRTRTLDDPKSWRGWDGKDFGVRFINPYTEPNADPAQHVCQPVSRHEIHNMPAASLTFNTYLNKFLMAGREAQWDPEQKKYIRRGFYYSLSNDLIHWMPMKLLMETKGWWPLDGREDAFAYPSLIDPNDTSRNFERTGQRPYLYYTHWHRGSGRDLVRVPIEFSHSPPPAPPPPGPSPDPLSEALDTALSFTTGGSADWFAQTTTSRYGPDAAQSGDISHRQDSWMQTTVSGKGTVKFYWKVSSEEDFDFLEFYIDGSLQDRISGLVNWEQQTYTISTSGSHTLELRYMKDGSGNYGSDCGWVDKVEWVTN